MLFHIAMDPLLVKLESEGSGFYIQGNSIMAILSGSYQGMVKNLVILD